MPSSPIRVRAPISFAVRALAADSVRCLLAVDGELDLATRPLLSAALDQQLGAGRRFVQLDLASLSFCDAAGLGSLIQSRSGFVAAGGSFSLIGCGPRLLRLLEITDLTAFLDASAIGASRPAVAAARLTDRRAPVEASAQ